MPVCTVPVLSTASVPFGVAFQVEVKGIPRPHGQVLVHAPSGTLWPAGRALGRGGQPRPTLIATPHPVRHAEPTPASGVPRQAMTGRVMLGYLAGVGAVGLMTVVVAGTMIGAADARRREAAEPRVLAEVVDRRDWDLELDVEYQDRGQQVSAVASAGYPLDFTEGRLYPAIVEGPNRVWLLAEPYDPREPIMWAYVPLVIGLALAAGPLSDLRESRRVLRGDVSSIGSTSQGHTGAQLMYATASEGPSGRVPAEIQLPDGTGDVLGEPSPGEVVVVTGQDGVRRFARVRPPVSWRPA